MKEKRGQEGGKEKERQGKNHDQKRVRSFPLVSKCIKAVYIPVHGCVYVCTCLCMAVLCLYIPMVAVPNWYKAVQCPCKGTQPSLGL